MRLVGFGRTLPLRFLVVLAIVGLAVAQVGGSALLVSAQGVATIEITNTDAGTGQPAPFTRFQVTSQNGTVYGPMETDLNGYVAFSVTVDPQGTRFTVEEETPPRVRRRPIPRRPNRGAVRCRLTQLQHPGRPGAGSAPSPSMR